MKKQTTFLRTDSTISHLRSPLCCQRNCKHLGFFIFQKEQGEWAREQVAVAAPPTSAILQAPPCPLVQTDRACSQAARLTLTFPGEFSRFLLTLPWHSECQRKRDRDRDRVRRRDLNGRWGQGGTERPAKRNRGGGAETPLVPSTDGLDVCIP